MFLIIPGELPFLDNILKFGFVAKEQCQISGKDTLLHVTQHCFVLCRAQMREDVVSFVLFRKNDKITKLNEKEQNYNHCSYNALYT